MDLEKQMRMSLSTLLNDKECLELAFYGTLHTGVFLRPHEYYCFFGLTQNDLLVANYSPLFRKNGFTIRIPLYINQVKIKKGLMSNKYYLNFRLNNTEQHLFDKFKIIVKINHPKISTQKENVELFFAYIEKHRQ